MPLWQYNFTGEDFQEPFPPVLILSAGLTETCSNIGVTDDAALEGDEVFSVSFSSPFFPLPTNISSAVVTILDNDSELSFVLFSSCYICQ